MQFVLNTSFDPHFCALFDEKNKLIAHTHWPTPKHDGPEVWHFLAQHLKSSDALQLIGGVSGPGGFSSLRTGGAVLNALSFKYQIPIHQARADQVLHDYLATQKLSPTPFLLNSFSQRVFLPQDGKLVVLEASQAAHELTEPIITSWLPPSKAELFKNQITPDPLGPLHTILSTLKKTTPQTHFVPDYEYPPVQ